MATALPSGFQLMSVCGDSLCCGGGGGNISPSRPDSNHLLSHSAVDARAPTSPERQTCSAASVDRLSGLVLRLEACSRMTVRRVGILGVMQRFSLASLNMIFEHQMSPMTQINIFNENPEIMNLQVNNRYEKIPSFTSSLFLYFPKTSQYFSFFFFTPIFRAVNTELNPLFPRDLERFMDNRWC